MSLLYQNHENPDSVVYCFEVGKYVSAWVEHTPTTFKFTMGHHTSRLGTGLEDAKKNGVIWTADIWELSNFMERTFEHVSRFSTVNQCDSAYLRVGKDKLLKMVYNKHAMKVEIKQGEHWVRMPAWTFKKLYKTIRNDILLIQGNVGYDEVDRSN